MAVRKLKSKQKPQTCSYCKDKAFWRGYGHSKFACELHYAQLVAWDKRASKEDYSDAQFYGR